MHICEFAARRAPCHLRHQPIDDLAPQGGPRSGRFWAAVGATVLKKHRFTRMKVTSTLRVGTELWVPAAALNARKVAQAAHWCEKYTVRTGCLKVHQIAKELHVSASDLILYNDGLGMKVSSTLRAGTELWVTSASAALVAAGLASVSEPQCDDDCE